MGEMQCLVPASQRLLSDCLGDMQVDCARSEGVQENSALVFLESSLAYVCPGSLLMASRQISPLVSANSRVGQSPVVQPWVLEGTWPCFSCVSSVFAVLFW